MRCAWPVMCQTESNINTCVRPSDEVMSVAGAVAFYVLIAVAIVYGHAAPPANR